MVRNNKMYLDYLIFHYEQMVGHSTRSFWWWDKRGLSNPIQRLDGRFKPPGGALYRGRGGLLSRHGGNNPLWSLQRTQTDKIVKS